MTTISNALITATITAGGDGFRLFERWLLRADGVPFAYAKSKLGKIVGIEVDSAGSGLLDGRYPVNGEPLDVAYIDVLDGRVVNTYYVKNEYTNYDVQIVNTIPFDFDRWPNVASHTPPIFRTIIQGPITEVIPIWESSGGNPSSVSSVPVITFGGTIDPGASGTGDGATFTPVIQDYVIPGTGGTGGTGGAGGTVTTPTTTVPTTIAASTIAAMIGNSNHDIFIRESMSLDVEINFPDDTLVNDPTDQSSLSHPYGWRTWVNPLQSDLDSDLRSPDNLWEPVFGEYVPVGGLSTSYLQKIKDYQDAKLVLNNGETIERFKSIWTDYTQLNDVFLDRIFDGKAESRVFGVNTLEKAIDKSRVFVYINGILQPSSNLLITKTTVAISPSVGIADGARLVVIYKKYQPTSDELKFDPETKDDINVNTQYRFIEL